MDMMNPFKFLPRYYKGSMACRRYGGILNPQVASHVLCPKAAGSLRPPMRACTALQLGGMHHASIRWAFTDPLRATLSNLFTT